MTTTATPDHGAGISARLERLPLSRWHRFFIGVLAIALLFEYMDLYTFAFTAPALMEREGYTLEDVARITAFTAFGTLIGAAMAGRLADRFGRRPVLLVCVATYSIGSMINGLVTAPEMFMGLRFLTAVGFQGMNVVAIVLVTELMPAAFRGRALAWAIGIGGIGPVIIAWVGYGVVPHIEWGWRVLYLIGGLGVVLLFALRNLVPESPRWLASVGRVDEAEAIVRKLEGRVLAEGLDIKSAAAVPAPKMSVGSTKRRQGLFAMLGAGWGGRLAFVSVVWSLGVVTYFGFNYWVSTMLKLRGFDLHEITLYTAIIVTVSALGPLVATMIIDRFERKHILVALGTIIAATAMILTTVSSTAMLIGLACLLGFFLQMAVAPTNTFAGEVLPNAYRSTGLGSANSVARLANIAVAPLIATLLLAFGVNGVFFLIVVLQVAFVIVIAVFGLRTKGTALEHISRESVAVDAGPVETAEAVAVGAVSNEGPAGQEHRS